MSINILGTGSYVPEKIITNDDLSQMVDTSDEWITKRVGIKTRRVSVSETTTDLAIKAAENALSDAGITADQLDLIIVSSLVPDSLSPTVAGGVQRAIGATCPAFDMNSACSGFLFALDTAVSFSLREEYETILVIGAERLSKMVDWTDRSVCIIFGDGAGAAVVQRGEGYLASSLFTRGGNEVIDIPGFVGHSPFFERELARPFIHMNGQETFKFAVNQIVEDLTKVSQKAGVSIEEIDHFIPHQANIRIIDFASKRLGVPIEKFAVNIDKYGNTSSASVPIALDELKKSGKLKRGELIAMNAFGGGLSSGACIMRF